MASPLRRKPREKRVENWNRNLRWAHFVVGLVISFYLFLMPADGWSDGFNNVMGFGAVGFVLWTGVLRWQLPRIRRWGKRRAAA
jgi:hypothetical protein